jgi:regulator of RNase E activity RraA
VRFVPTDKPLPRLSPDEFFEWMNDWYQNLAAGPINDQIKQGEIIVIDGYEIGTVGFIGSNNSLQWMASGALGVVTNGGARDTDEIIKQRVPTYCRYVNKTIRPGRLELESTQKRISVGGVSVSPGDVVVADGDGVVVVPESKAEDVAKYAWMHANSDKAGRKKYYQELGLPLDFTVDV